MSYHKKIVAFLRDGKYHSLREVVGAVKRFIDAKTADNEYRKRHPKWATVAPKTRVELGKKRLVFLSLNTMHHHRDMVEVRERGQDWDREYRLTKETLKRLAAKDKKRERAVA